MATVKTWKKLEMALQKARDKALKDTGKKTKELVKDRIDKDRRKRNLRDIFRQRLLLRFLRGRLP